MSPEIEISPYQLPELMKKIGLSWCVLIRDGFTTDEPPTEGCLPRAKSFAFSEKFRKLVPKASDIDCNTQKSREDLLKIECI